MGRIRELLAYGGIALLAVVFALAFATLGLADAASQIIVAAIQQHTADPDAGTSGFGFRLFGTDIEAFYLVQEGLAFMLLALLLFAIWRFGRGTSRRCPECHSEVPRGARIFRFCTTDLPTTTVS